FCSYMVYPSFLSDLVLQTMHRFFCFIPWHFIALALGTKNGSRGVERVCGFVIADSGDHFILIMTEIIPVEKKAECTFSMGECRKFRTVIHKISHWNTACDQRFSTACFRS